MLLVMSKVNTNNISIEVAENETRNFIGNKLENNIKYVNIEDSTLEKSSLIVSVNTGSIAEDIELQGLAHFLEHMLFLGSKKYPNESYFDEFISKNGGYSNAYTDTYQTVYYFTVLNDSFEKSMDIFSRFFIDPLFDENSVDRELNAIESEHLKNVQSDLWRYSYFTDLISKKKSMINKFSTGNLLTLKKPNVREKMIEFYNKYYISSNIKISTVSSISNKITSKLVNKYFGGIRKCTIQEEKQGKIINIKPFYNKGLETYYLKTINEINYLTYLWEIPTYEDYYKENLSPEFVRMLIISKNEKSLSVFLKRKGLIKSVLVLIDNKGTFNVIFDLTEITYWKEVDSYFKYFMASLKSIDLNKVCNYYNSVDKLLFNIGTKGNSLDLGLLIANNLHYLPINKSNVGTNYPIKTDINKVQELIGLLNFSDVKIILCNNSIDKINGIKIDSLKTTEPYYGLEWSKISVSTVNASESLESNETKFPINIEELVPYNNPYLNIKPVVDTKIKLTEPITEPVKIKLTNRGKISNCSYNNDVWFGNTYKYNEAIIYTNLVFTNLDLVKTLENYLLTKIYINYINYKILIKFNLEFELEYTAGLSLNSNLSLIELTISGWNDKYHEFFRSIMKYIKSIEYKSEDKMILRSIIKSIEQDAQHIVNDKPWDYSDYIVKLNTVNNTYKYDQVLKLLPKLVVNKFSLNNIKELIFKKSHFKMCVYGNTNMDILQQNLGYATYYFNNCKKCILNKSYELSYKKNLNIMHPNKDESNNCFTYYYYISEFSIKTISLLLLFQSSINQKFYDSLRTKQQFGYLVNSSVKKINTNYYFIEKIQSERSIEDIQKAIDEFNKDFINMVFEKDFDKFKKSLHDSLKEPDSSTIEVASRFFSEITKNTYLFNREELLGNEVLTIKYSEFIEFVKKVLNDTIPVKVCIKSNLRKIDN
jgi:insulysin